MATFTMKSIGTETTASARPKPRATSGERRPAGRGRLRVRAMRASMSRSHHMFSAFAEPTMSAVPASERASARPPT